MKKNLILSLSLLLFAAATMVIAEQSDASIALENEINSHKKIMTKKLSACSPYLYRGDTFVANVFGVKNNKCIYSFRSTLSSVDCEIPYGEMRNIEAIDTAKYCHAPEGETADYSVNVLFKK